MGSEPVRPKKRRAPGEPRGRNEYGDPNGTVYVGGTPLFDERTGASRLLPVTKPKPKQPKSGGD